MPDEVRTHAERNAVEALKIDLEAGLTRATIASQAPEQSEKRHRNWREARKAYDSVMGFMQRFTLTPTDAQEIGDKLAKLKSALERSRSGSFTFPSKAVYSFQLAPGVGLWSQLRLRLLRLTPPKTWWYRPRNH